jgi:hypothetical protein
MTTELRPDGTRLDAATLERLCAERVEELAAKMPDVAVEIASAIATGDDDRVADAASHLQELVALRYTVRKASRLLTIKESKLPKLVGLVLQDSPARRDRKEDRR